jgi:hypothetical protein
MTVKPLNEVSVAIEAAIRGLKIEIERAKEAVERIDAFEKISLQNKIDVLIQRKGALSQRLEQLRAASGDPAVRDAIQGGLETELDDLQRTVRQVAEYTKQRASAKEY